MKKNSHIHLLIETELLEKLKKEAKEKEIHLSELCRQKLIENSKFNEIQFLLEEMNKRIKYLT